MQDQDGFAEFVSEGTAFTTALREWVETCGQPALSVFGPRRQGKTTAFRALAGRKVVEVGPRAERIFFLYVDLAKESVRGVGELLQVTSLGLDDDLRPGSELAETYVGPQGESSENLVEWLNLVGEGVRSRYSCSRIWLVLDHFERATMDKEFDLGMIETVLLSISASEPDDETGARWKLVFLHEFASREALRAFAATSRAEQPTVLRDYGEELQWQWERLFDDRTMPFVDDARN